MPTRLRCENCKVPQPEADVVRCHHCRFPRFEVYTPLQFHGRGLLTAVVLGGVYLGIRRWYFNDPISLLQSNYPEWIGLGLILTVGIVPPMLLGLVFPHRGTTIVSTFAGIFWTLACLWVT